VSGDDPVPALLVVAVLAVTTSGGFGDDDDRLEDADAADRRGEFGDVAEVGADIRRVGGEGPRVELDELDGGRGGLVGHGRAPSCRGVRGDRGGVVRWAALPARGTSRAHSGRRATGRPGARTILRSVRSKMVRSGGRRGRLRAGRAPAGSQRRGRAAAGDTLVGTRVTRRGGRRMPPGPCVAA